MIFTGDTAKQADEAAIPRGWISTEPPKGDGVWQWASDHWAKLDEYPKDPPSPPPSTEIDRLELVKMLAATGKGEALGKALAALPTAYREEWYARQMVDLADPRIQLVMTALEIDLGKAKETKPELEPIIEQPVVAKNVFARAMDWMRGTA
jgi:hypothetical protein